ncbi:MAG: omcB 2 [Planctomycetaceae bacterium]|nr:omcB 2 [Planctomycetaceae bacterium]
MRKIWWLPVICIAAGAVQALFAADETTTPARKSFLGGRSRLLIYSKNKSQVRNPDVVAEDKTPTARAKVSDESDFATDTTPRIPTGNTGTVSPSTRYSTQTARPATATAAPRQRNLITPSATTPRTPVAKAPTAKAPIAETKTASRLEENEDLVETDDAAIRKLFEDIEPAIPPKKQPVRQPAARPAATAQLEAETDPFAEAAAKPAAAVSAAKLPTANDQARKAARYKELLESIQSGNEQPAAELTSNKKAQEKIQPVSGREPSSSELEVNPFEPSERPTKVVNAGLKEEAGSNTKRRVIPASAAAAAPKAAAEKTPAVKAAVTKMPETKKPAGTATGAAIKPASTSKDVATKSTSHSTPAANNQAPQVDVTWEARGEVTLGEQCQCVLIVKNNGKVSARDIIVEASFPESVKLVESVPFPKSSSAKLEWQFGNLAAGEQKTIELTMVPTKRGELAASAQVRFTGTAATSFQVSEPMLTATVKMASEVHLGEPAAATVTVSNPGTGTAQNVVVHALLPAGLESSSGKEFATEIGPLGPGETRTVRLGMIAMAGGEQTLKVIAKSTTGSLEHATQSHINVLAPSLKLAATGPSLRYMHRAAKYAVTVTNNSNTATENVRITQVVAAGFDYVKADHGGRWDSQTRTVSWYIGHLEAGQEKTVELEIVPQKLGEVRHVFKVSGDAGAEATAVVATRVEGAASLVMEVKDADDPIEVGSEMTYEIRVHNEGSKSASKVAISCELPPDIELVKVDGPTGHIVESGVLIFKPAGELAARESLTYKITVKSTVAGTTKLRARLTSESIQKPLIVEEATQFYAE